MTRALIAWGILAFAVLQVAEPVMHAFHLPEWTLTAVVSVLGAGFPITVVLAWVFDLTAKGVTRTAPAPAQAPAAEGAPSIAVLAFADLSPAKDQEYFSDGISEEILNALARVKGLKVAGRTSSFHFKGRNEDLHAIGAALGVQNVLEGSVRKQGNRVRITAQLIEAKDGFHLWSRTYDGELTDVFELQERIARAITEELKVVLQGDPRARLAPVATRNPEAYALYLQATAIFNRRDGSRFADAISQLDQAVVLDPGYARAHSRLAALHAVTPSYSARDVKASLAAAEKHARRAIELDAGLAEPHAVLDRVLVLDPILPNASCSAPTTSGSSTSAWGSPRCRTPAVARKKPSSASHPHSGSSWAISRPDRQRSWPAGSSATTLAIVTGIAPYALIRLGQPARTLEVLQAGPTGNDALAFGVLWGPYGRAARALPAFPEFARKVGLAGHWDRHGAPDGCRRVGTLDYRCE